MRGVGYRLSDTPEMNRLPIRIRLTLPFALAMAVVLAALGAFVYFRVGSTLLRSTDQNLLAHATEATLRLDGPPPLDRDAATGVSFAQVLDGTGAVVTLSPRGCLRSSLRPRRGAWPRVGRFGRALRSRGRGQVATAGDP